MLVVYIDSTECSLCRGKSLRDYGHFNTEALDKHAIQLRILFSPRIVDQPEMIDYLVLYGPDFPVYIDVQRSFSERNIFPEDYAVHTFLLNEDGFPVLVGDPVYDKRTRRKFDRMLAKLARFPQSQHQSLNRIFI